MNLPFNFLQKTRCKLKKISDLVILLKFNNKTITYSLINKVFKNILNIFKTFNTRDF